MGRRTRIALWVLASPFLTLGWLLASVAIHYSNLPWPGSRLTLAWAFGLAGPAAVAFLPNRRRTLLVLLVVFLGVVAWHASIRPSNDRDWRIEVARIPDARFEGDLVHVTNVRNFDYRTEDDFDVRYYDKTFDLAKLEATDMLFSYWDGNEAIAHTMLSFDFGGTDFLCVSVEVRREKGEGWGGLPGMFKQFEIVYVLADERDVVRLRTNYRGEEVYLFRSRLSPDESRLLLVHILEKVHRLNEQPEFYRTIANNCTTSLVNHINAVWPDRVPFTKKLLMNGYLPEQAYERSTLATDLPFAEFKASRRINDRARAADDDPAFSRRIRE